MADFSVASKKFDLRRQLMETLDTHQRTLALLPANHELVHKIREIDTIMSREIATTDFSLGGTERRRPKPIKLPGASSQILPSLAQPTPRSSLATSLEGSLFVTPPPQQQESRATELSYSEIASRHPPAPQTEILPNHEGIRLEQARLAKKRKAPKQPSNLPRSIFKKHKA
ncbi:hypothetical protein ACHAPJ_009648 [Fusarium lateritium]